MSNYGKDAVGHEKLLAHFEEAFDDTQDERRDSERDRDYYDGIQLTDEELETLRQRKQPIVISNRVKPKIDALLGFEKRQRTDPRAYPRTPKHDQDAEGATDAIRFVCDQNRFSQTRSAAAENMFIEGIGAATVTMKPRQNGDMEVEITHVPWDRFYRDPHSRKRDFSDAGYMGVVLWMDEADVLAEFKGKEDIVASCYADDAAAEGETYDDRPRTSWSDKRRKRVRVLQHRWREGRKWMTAIVSKGGYLREPQESPYLDENGNPECDIVAVSCYVTRDNVRYGVVRNMISAQDEINKRRSKALHRLSVRQVIAEQGAVDDVAQAKLELAKPDGWIEHNKDFEFEIVNTDQLAMGELELLREAKAEIDASGVNPALEGDLKAPSGRAVEALTQAGLAEQAVAFDALRDWSWRVYRQVWNRIRQFWTEERWVRVTDDERNLKWVGLNHPVTAAEMIAKQAEEAGQPLPPEELEALKADPQMQQVEQIENQLAELDVDIILEDGPDSVTIQSEQFEQLVELKKADPASIPTEMVIEASSLRNKDKILEHIQKGGVPPQVQQQMQEMEQALKDCQEQLQQAEAKVADRQGDMAVKAAELQIKEQELQIRTMELEIERFRAETERMQAMKPDPQPTDKNQNAE